MQDEFIKSVFDVSEQFMKSARYVTIEWNWVKSLAKQLKRTKEPDQPEKIEYAAIDILHELVANSINYCYWYGRGDVKNWGATQMYSIVDDAFDICNEFDYEQMRYINHNLTFYRFPLLEERIKHLNEVYEKGMRFASAFMMYDKEDRIPPIEFLLDCFPGYASDMFLKRASLFFLAMHRKFKCFDGYLKSIHVPADYQIPKILRYQNCISYNDELYDIIKRHELIPKHSRMECEIRAATVLACKKIQELSGWSISDIDWWFWSRRKKCEHNFHLTETTDY